MMQIKIAQGAKPGEGGQLPGHKVDATIAKVRHSTPGVGLISPPPHHDIYSIEDLAQLIYDLKNVNPAADVSVKLVSEVGVGTVAAGVAKARADHITISGYDGGTGASPLTSIKHAGSPWEIGPCRDAADAGAERPALARRAAGRRRPEDRPRRHHRRAARRRRVRLRDRAADRGRLHHDAQVPSQHLSGRRRDAGSGAAQALQGHSPSTSSTSSSSSPRRCARSWPRWATPGSTRSSAQSELLDKEEAGRTTGRRAGSISRASSTSPTRRRKRPTRTERQKHPIDDVLDRKLIEEAQPALEARRAGQPSNCRSATSTARPAPCCRARWPSASATRACKNDTIIVKLTGTAGQSFGAFLARGVTFDLVGDANDYVGKGLSGGRIVVRPPENTRHRRRKKSIIVGNTVLYGATEGECYFRGVAGERFAVRNSGAIAVVEGVGDHGCEYMTGGIVVVIGKTGRNFAAGMSGGIAYVLDEEGDFAERCNMAMVELEPVPGRGRAAGAAAPSRRRHRVQGPRRRHRPT